MLLQWLDLIKHVNCCNLYDDDYDDNDNNDDDDDNATLMLIDLYLSKTLYLAEQMYNIVMQLLASALL